MPASGSFRSRILAGTIASAVLGALGFSTIGYGAAVVGESRKVEITQRRRAVSRH